MQIDITDVIKNQRDNVYVENRFFESQIDFNESRDIQICGPLLLNGKFSVAGNRIILSGMVTGKLLLRCSRCLEDFEQDISADIEEEFVKDRKEASFDASYLEGSSVDIIPIIKKNILLSLPIKSLCSNECKGLCHKCGVDLNNSTCDCKKYEVDSRLSVLKSLLKE